MRKIATTTGLAFWATATSAWEGWPLEHNLPMEGTTLRNGHKVFGLHPDARGGESLTTDAQYIQAFNRPVGFYKAILIGPVPNDIDVGFSAEDDACHIVEGAHSDVSRTAVPPVIKHRKEIVCTGCLAVGVKDGSRGLVGEVGQ